MASILSTIGISYDEVYKFVCSAKGILCIAVGVTAVVIGSRYLFRTGSVRKTWNKNYDFIIGK